MATSHVEEATGKRPARSTSFGVLGSGPTVFGLGLGFINMLSLACHTS